MIQHRFRTVVIVGEWRATRMEAYQDALRAGQARPDESEPEGVRWAVPGVIEITTSIGPEPAAARPPPAKSPSFGNVS